MDLLGALNDGINYLSVLNTKLGNDLNVHNMLNVHTAQTTHSWKSRFGYPQLIKRLYKAHAVKQSFSPFCDQFHLNKK